VEGSSQVDSKALLAIGVEPEKVSDSPESYRIRLTDINQSLAIIEELTKEYSIHPQVRKLVSTLISPCQDRDYDCYIRKIVSFIKSTVKYVNDPPKTEVFQSPLRTLDYKMGDCDDHAILTATLLRAAGFKVKVVLGAPNGNRYDHVYVKVLHPGKGWLTIDTTSENPTEGKMYPEVDVFTLGEEETPVDLDEIHEVEGELAELGEEPYELGRGYTGRRWVWRWYRRRLYRELWYYRNGRRVKLLRRYLFTGRRWVTTRSYRALVYYRHGKPVKVLKRIYFRRHSHHRPIRSVKRTVHPKPSPSHVAASFIPMLLPMAAVGGLIYLLK